ncbi:MAG: hypothetical protein IPI77_15470 [Saprospiraceae bacterium]|nr:hypothetical protein [Saprospiraceae bacterium]
MKEWTIQLIRWMRKYYFHLGVGALIAIRCFHLGSEIDSPHDWRQCDTAHYIRDFTEMVLIFFILRFAGWDHQIP